MRNSIRYSSIIVLGIAFGIFVFLPINELTSYYEYTPNSDIGALKFIRIQLWKAITFQTPVKLIFYSAFGAIMGGVSIISLIVFRRRNNLIFQLRNELDKDLAALLKQGEDDELEFKSSFRYDYRLQKVNKNLEITIIKTIAGFMNSGGGSLLIGIADNGSVLGLEPDYNTLNRKDSDGYTQLLMSAVAKKLGTPACKLIRILFQKVEDKEVCRLIILPSPTPIYVNDENQRKFYVRTGSSTREMDVQDAINFIKAKWG